MIPESLLTRLDPYREMQTISIQPAEFAALVKGDTANSQDHRIVVVETEAKRHSGSLPSFKGTFSWLRK
jgi:hypothetical protein